MNKFLAPLVLFLFFNGCRPFVFYRTWTFNGPAIDRAEEAEKEGNFQEAITAYREHMENRLAIPDRPDWENPYFYLLTIGDLQLKLDHVEDALASYTLAESKGVEPNLTSDRYRRVAEWYEAKGRTQEAMNLLKTYRSKDPLLFDGMLDRLSKEMIEREERKRDGSAL